jgi:hypothetical protein
MSLFVNQYCKWAATAQFYPIFHSEPTIVAMLHPSSNLPFRRAEGTLGSLIKLLPRLGLLQVLIDSPLYYCARP